MRNCIDRAGRKLGILLLIATLPMTGCGGSDRPAGTIAGAARPQAAVRAGEASQAEAARSLGSDGERQILFGDVDAMYASAAVVADPALAGKPIAVGGRPPRGIITAASYPARRFGVGSAMPTAHALRLCPDLVLVPPDWPLYRRLPSRMREVTNGLFPATAWSSIDEFYADTTELQALYPNPRMLGQTVKDALLEATGLWSTVAVATGKTIAKVATDQHKPDGLAVIEPGTEAAFLGPLPIEALPGIGPKTAVTLHRWNVRLIGDLLKPHVEPLLRSLWGTRRFVFTALARGIDSEPLVTDRQPKSMGHETTFEHDTNEVAFLEEERDAIRVR